MRSVSSSRIERWAGRENVEHLSRLHKGWYGPKPIPIASFPGDVRIGRDGDFVGTFDMGAEACAEQWLRDNERRTRAIAFRQGGFVDLTALRKAPKQVARFEKTIGVNINFAAGSAWLVGNIPVAAAAPGAAPGGTIPTSASQGAISFRNADSGNKLHVVSADYNCPNVNHNRCALMYDLIFAVNKTMNSTATEAVTGVPTRYQNTVQGSEDSAENNFLFIQVGLTVLPATAHNWTVCTYTDQSGNAGATLPSVTGVSAAATHRLDMPISTWFAPLAAGDTGVQKLTQMQCSALVATGTIHFMMGHPLCWMFNFTSNYRVSFGGVNNAIQLGRVFDNAALAMLEMPVGSSNSTNLHRADILLAEGA